MKRKTIKNIWTILFFILFTIILCAVSWATTCGIVYLITLCFNWTFKWSIATGIWLIMVLVTFVTVKK